MCKTGLVIHDVRVIFGDTDQMGIVYYANYYRYFEAARAALLRAHGKSNLDMLALGVALPVVESHCRYRSPAHYEDLLAVTIEVDEIRAASLRFGYKVHVDGRFLVDGYTVHACVNPEGGRPRRIPAELLAILESESSTAAESR